MDKLKLSEIYEFLNLESLTNEDLNITGLSTDTRNIRPGDIFIALVGKNFDGHDYINIAVEKGAVCVVVSQKIDINISSILVEDTLKALKLIAKGYKNKLNIEAVAVTGSAGKTTTKEMIASVLSQSLKVHKTDKNFNNEIGVPLTLMNLSKDHEISVLEFGMNNFGEIEELAKVATPNIGVITNIGTAHIENLGNKEGILKAKMELTKDFEENNVLIINNDDEYLSGIKSDKYKIVRIGINKTADFTAFDIKEFGIEGIEFKCIYKGEELLIKVPIPGIHNVYNALFTVAIASNYNLSGIDIIKGIQSFKPLKQRMDIIRIGNGITIINDTYNANPESMKATLDVLKTYSEGERIAVLGDMLELGDHSAQAHERIVEYSKDKCEMLLTVGEEFNKVIYKAEGNFKHFTFKDKNSLFEFLKTNIGLKATILIKGSRGMKMEEIVEKLLFIGRGE